MPCSIDQFISRLRKSRLLPDAEVDSLGDRTEVDGSLAAIAKELVDAGKLTLFQVKSLLEDLGDPLILGEYIVQDQVGRGGMGTVYRAIHRRMKRTVAIKVLRRDIPDADFLSKRFLREVEVAARLCHPNIVMAYDAGEQNGVSFLVSEFIEGQNLGDLVRQYGPLSLPLAVDVVQQTARALQYAHGEGVIHRDIKPSNLLLDDSGNVKLLDVGLARISPSELSDPDAVSDLTTTGMIMGTVDYMSPEQALNTRLADERSDVYSLGCTLYFLMTGRAPFASGTAMERLLAHREQPIPMLVSLSTLFPSELDELLSSMLAKDPSQRIESMNKLVERLEAMRASDLPDVTLPCSTAGNDVMADATDEAEYEPTEAIPELSTSKEMPSASSLPATAIGMTAGSLDETDVDATTLLQVADSEPNTTNASSRRRSSVSSQASILPWIIVPGFAAVALLFWYFGPTWNGAKDELRDTASGRPNVESLTDQSEEEASSYRSKWASSLGLDTEQTLNGVTFLLLPPGRFLFGEGETSVETELPQPLYLTEVEVTVEQFRAFVEASDNYQTLAERNGNGWGLVAGQWVQGPGYCWRNLGENFVGDSTPATSISYPDAMAFCDWMSSVTKQIVRLPREEEWEYACRCGRRGEWSFGDDAVLLDQYAWVRSNSKLEIHPVRQLLPNAWGLFDMHGNESEWCLEPTVQLSAYSGQGSVRGGGFYSSDDEARCSARFRTDLMLPTRGAFRVLMEYKPSEL